MTRVPLRELPEFVRNITAALAMDRTNTKAVVLALVGQLGAGKTTFVQTLAKQMGIYEPVQSPTYVLMKNYMLPEGLNPFGQKRRFKKLVHIDAYRLESPGEFDALKPSEFLSDPSNLVVVEWPERLGERLPKPDMTLRFLAENMPEDERDIDAV